MIERAQTRLNSGLRKMKTGMSNFSSMASSWIGKSIEKGTIQSRAEIHL